MFLLLFVCQINGDIAGAENNFSDVNHLSPSVSRLIAIKNQVKMLFARVHGERRFELLLKSTREKPVR